ncbi:MAG: hypothetical protein ABSC63_18060 [Candidatus Binataceae bacterium]|jgi:hypothetical protein
MDKAHDHRRKTFEELTFQQQARSLSMRALKYRKGFEAHLRRAQDEGRDTKEAAKKLNDLLRNIIADFQHLEL